MATARKTPTKAASRAVKSPVQGGAKGTIAASFECSVNYSQNYAINSYVMKGRSRAMVDRQKYRNNYANMDLRDLFHTCRRISKSHWFLRPVLVTRHASHTDGFRALDSKGQPLPVDTYDFSSLVSDIAWEDLRTSNAVALWKKGGNTPPAITILKSEQCELISVGGLDILRIHYAKLTCGKLNSESTRAINSALGERMAKVQVNGGYLEIVKGLDDEWDFEVMRGGDRGDGLENPEIESILDSIDFLELMNIGDWNMAWFRKDIIRQAKKGYKGTGGQGVTSGSEITKPQIKSLGEGMAKINGNANVPMNHDIEFSYLTVNPENFDPKQIEMAINRLKIFGGIEGAVLIGGFSQQNGAAPTLMRNARAIAFARRSRIERFLNLIFSRDEFSAVMSAAGGEMKYAWNNRTLYSIDEMLAIVRTTSDGVASARTRREWLGLDHDQEGDRIMEEHANRERVTPAFEPRQGMIPAMFPRELQSGSEVVPAGGEGESGRPASVSEI